MAKKIGVRKADTMIGYCKHCTHWDRRDRATVKQCCCPKFAAYTDMAVLQSPDAGLAIVYPRMVTGPEFGCVHFEPAL